MSGRPRLPNPLLNLQDVLDAAFAAELIEEGRDPVAVLKEQAASRPKQTDPTLRLLYEFRAGPTHRAQRRIR